MISHGIFSIAYQLLFNQLVETVTHMTVKVLQTTINISILS